MEIISLSEGLLGEEDEMEREQWIEFVEMDKPPERKTKIWTVFSKQGKGLLGTVQWMNGWRRYAFSPYREFVTFFEADCLQDLSNFCKIATTKHMKSLHYRKD
jgi:hypothetical protein